MALQAASVYASFDVPAGAFIQDISPALADAIYFDLNFMEAVPLGWDSPVEDTVHRWNEDALNADIVTSTASIAAGGVTLSVSSVTGTVAIGSLLTPNLLGNEETLQVTAIVGLDLTVTRGYNGTTAASLPSGTVFGVIDAMQSGSDIGADSSVSPVVRLNRTQIFGTRDLQVSGTQLARRMATNELEDFVGHQLANRTTELKRKLIKAFLYSELSTSDVGSDTVYRTLTGLRNWARVNGQRDVAAVPLTLAILNAHNKLLVDLGEYVDTLVIGTDLVGSVAAIDVAARRMYESDTSVGYTVQEILLAQGNTVRVVIDNRVVPGEYFLFTKSKVKPLPMNGRGMFTIAATDFSDARKRRVLAEWTMRVHNPEVLGHAKSKT
jgi:hypothetical protein